MPCAGDHARFAAALLDATPFARARPGLAMLGAQGPDPFYFCGRLPWRRRGGKVRAAAFASAAHGAAPKDYFGPLTRAAGVSSDRDGAFAFVYGLLLHYVLDACVHPYVYALACVDGGVHARLETGMAEASDRAAGIPAARARPRALLAADPRDVDLGDRLFSQAFPGALLPGDYAASWEDMVSTLSILWDPSGLKRAAADLIGFGSSVPRGLVRPGFPAPADRDWLNLGRAAWARPRDGSVRSESVPDLEAEAAAAALRGAAALEALRSSADASADWDLVAGGLDHEGSFPE